MKVYPFFGLAGSGKGTQRELLEAHFEKKGVSFLPLETGHLLREYVAEDESLQRKHLGDIMGAGGLVPSAFPITMWVNTLMVQDTDYDVLLFDGAGRQLVEAKILVELIRTMYDAEVHILLLDITEEEAVTRLMKRGRQDDLSEDAIRTRFSLFHDAESGTAASLAYLRTRPDVTVHTIDGMGTVEEVHQRVLSAIGDTMYSLHTSPPPSV